MAHSAHGGFQDGFIEIVEEQLKICQEEVRGLDRQIERKQQEIAQLRAQRGDAAKRVQRLEGLLRDPDSDEHQPTAPDTNPQSDRPIAGADAVVELLREQGKPMHYLDIHKTLVSRGFKIGGKGNPDTLLSRYFNEPRLVRLSPGTYGLRENQPVEPAPDISPKTPPSRLKLPTLPSPPVRGLTGRMTVAEMAAETLRQAGKPLHYRKITDRILKTGAWKTNGKTPRDSVNSVMVVDIRDNGDNSTFVRTSRGVYGLREWNEDEP